MEKMINSVNDYTNEGIISDPGRSSSFIRFKNNYSDVYGIRTNHNTKGTHFKTLLSRNQKNDEQVMESKTMYNLNHDNG